MRRLASRPRRPRGLGKHACAHHCAGVQKCVQILVVALQRGTAARRGRGPGEAARRLVDAKSIPGQSAKKWRQRGGGGVGGATAAEVAGELVSGLVVAEASRICVRAVGAAWPASNQPATNRDGCGCGFFATPGLLGPPWTELHRSRPAPGPAAAQSQSLTLESCRRQLALALCGATADGVGAALRRTARCSAGPPVPPVQPRPGPAWTAANCSQSAGSRQLTCRRTPRGATRATRFAGCQTGDRPPRTSSTNRPRVFLSVCRLVLVSSAFAGLQGDAETPLPRSSDPASRASPPRNQGK